MQGMHTLHASIPKGLARPTTLPDHSHPHKARMPPPLTRRCQAPAHPPGAHNPTCKEPVHPPPLSPCHPPRAGPITLQARAPPRWRGGGQGTPTGDPAGWAGGAGRDGRAGGCYLPAQPGLLPSPLSYPGIRGQRDPQGTPRTGLSKTEQPPAFRSPQPPPSGPRARGWPSGYLKSPWRRRRLWRVRATRSGQTLRAGRTRRAGGAAAPETCRRRRVPSQAMCHRGAPAHWSAPRGRAGRPTRG